MGMKTEKERWTEKGVEEGFCWVLRCKVSGLKWVLIEWGRWDMGRYSRGWMPCLGSDYEDGEGEEDDDDERRGVRKVSGEGKGLFPSFAICR